MCKKHAEKCLAHSKWYISYYHFILFWAQWQLPLSTFVYVQDKENVWINDAQMKIILMTFKKARILV